MKSIRGRLDQPISERKSLMLLSAGKQTDGAQSAANLHGFEILLLSGFGAYISDVHCDGAATCSVRSNLSQAWMTCSLAGVSKKPSKSRKS
jgi:hypothetical protein